MCGGSHVAFFDFQNCFKNRFSTLGGHYFPVFWRFFASSLQKLKRGLIFGSLILRIEVGVANCEQNGPSLFFFWLFFWFFAKNLNKIEQRTSVLRTIYQRSCSISPKVSKMLIFVFFVVFCDFLAWVRPKRNSEVMELWPKHDSMFLSTILTFCWCWNQFLYCQRQKIKIVDWNNTKLNTFFWMYLRVFLANKFDFLTLLARKNDFNTKTMLELCSETSNHPWDKISLPWNSFWGAHGRVPVTPPRRFENPDSGSFFIWFLRFPAMNIPKLVRSSWYCILRIIRCFWTRSQQLFGTKIIFTT